MGAVASTFQSGSKRPIPKDAIATDSIAPPKKRRRLVPPTSMNPFTAFSQTTPSKMEISHELPDIILDEIFSYAVPIDLKDVLTWISLTPDPIQTSALSSRNYMGKICIRIEGSSTSESDEEDADEDEDDEEDCEMTPLKHKKSRRWSNRPFIFVDCERNEMVVSFHDRHRFRPPAKQSDIDGLLRLNTSVRLCIDLPQLGQLRESIDVSNPTVLKLMTRFEHWILMTLPWGQFRPILKEFGSRQIRGLDFVMDENIYKAWEGRFLMDIQKEDLPNLCEIRTTSKTFLAWGHHSVSEYRGVLLLYGNDSTNTQPLFFLKQYKKLEKLCLTVVLIQCDKEGPSHYAKDFDAIWGYIADAKLKMLEHVLLRVVVYGNTDWKGLAEAMCVSAERNKTLNCVKPFRVGVELTTSIYGTGEEVFKIDEASLDLWETSFRACMSERVPPVPFSLDGVFDDLY